MDFCEYFKDKKITLMRIGLLGRGVGDAAFLAECGAIVHVVDDAPQEVMQPSVDALREYDNITFTFGPYQTEHFTEADMVLVGAGAPYDLPVLVAARDAGVELAMSGALFAKLSSIPIIGVTGTRGKSTVTHMIHHTLEVATGESIILGGNIRGVSNLQLLKDVKEDSLAVMELDSWQLQGFGWASMSPQIAVFTNFMDDHLNYYKGDRDQYFADKANIFLNQDDGGTFVTTPEVFSMAKVFIEKKGLQLRQEVLLADTSSLPEGCILAMPGEHNRLNAALAYEALRALSLSEQHIEEGLTTFRGVEGRLEYLREVDGVKIYNDNNATTPAATLAGIEAVADGKNVVLIMGGTDKGIDTSELVSEISSYCKKVVLLPGTGTERLLSEIDKNNSMHRTIFTEVDSLEEAVKAAVDSADRGDVILFSPGFASHGMFRNEYDRNDQFVACVNSLE